MKHILLTVYSLGPGGVQSLVYDLAKKLKQPDYKISILTFEPCNSEYQLEVYNELLINDIDLIIPKFKLKNRFSRFLYVYRNIKLRKDSIDLIHAHTPIPHSYVAIVAGIFKIRTILTFHNVNLWLNKFDHCKGILGLMFIKPFTSGYVAISENVKSAMINRYNIKSNKIVTIYNGIDILKFSKSKHSNETKSLELPEIKNKFVISHIASVDFERKNQDKVIEIFYKIKGEIPNAILLFVGTGKDYDALIELTKGIQDIIVLGNRSDIPPLLSLSNICILPSETEGLPIVILESLASSTPVIATNVGSVGEIIQNNFNGLLIEQGKFDDLVNAIVRLHTDQDLYKRISINSKDSVYKFSLENFINKHIDYYTEILKR